MGGVRKPPILKVLSVPMLMQAAQTRSVKMDKGMTGAAARSASRASVYVPPQAFAVAG